MDINMCVSVLQACCSANQVERQAGEDELKKVCIATCAARIAEYTCFIRHIC